MKRAPGFGGSGDLGIDGYVEFVPVGQGGFGSVYRCRQLAFNRIVAVKILGASHLDPDVEIRFRRECLAIGALSGHPHILTVHDSGTTKWGRPYIVMDYMAGGSLVQRLREEGAFPWQAATEIGIKISGAVAAAHAAGILHRDIKPQNVLVSKYAEPTLGDFGISTIPSGYQTHSGVVTASLAHAAPEILDGRPATQASDVYSLASTIFCLIKGAPPFVENGDEGPAALISRTLTHSVPDLRALAPASICDVLERAMAKSPLDRPDSAHALGDALRSAQRLEGVPITPMPSRVTIDPPPLLALNDSPHPGDVTRSRRRGRLETSEEMAPRRPRFRFRAAALLLTAVALVAGSGIALALRDSGETQPTSARKVVPSASPTASKKVRRKAPKYASVKSLSIAYGRDRREFKGTLKASRKACASDRKVRLLKSGRGRPVASVTTTRSGKWSLRLPRVSGRFVAKVETTKRSRALVCDGGRSKSKVVKPRPARHDTPPAGADGSAVDVSTTVEEPAPPDVVHEPVVQPSPLRPRPTPTKATPPEPKRTSPPPGEVHCPPGQHLESGGTCAEN